jgi:hypothetical protein
VPPGTPSRPISIAGFPDAKQFDLNGDGVFDGVDVDDDGILDGGDFDGDGVATIFKLEGTGELPASAGMMQSALDRDDVAALLTFDAAVVGIEPAPSVDLSTLFPRPGNQGSQGSCAAWSVAGAASYLRVARDQSSPSWASAAYLYAKMVPASESMCGKGTHIYTGLNELVMNGSADLATVPYDDTQCATDLSVDDAYQFQIGGYQIMRTFDRTTVKKYLTAGIPISFATTLPSNFSDLFGDLGKQVLTSATGQLDNEHGSGHAMVLVGYDDSQGAYRILNSWGTDFADAGFLWWDYDDLESRDGLYALVPTALRGQPAKISPDAQSFACTVDRAASNSAKLALSVSCNQPVLLAHARLSEMPSATRDFPEGFALFTADLVLPGPSLASGSYTLELTGSLQDGAPVSTTAQVSIQ